MEDFSKHKQHEIYRALKKAQDFDEVIEIIPFHSKKEKEKFISTVKKDLENIQPYDESFAVL
ncbi:hypothetical protein IJU97_05320 [bacterium]|nr:hypothetical protein [bacterium]